MPNIYGAISAHLRADVPLAAIVGTRIYAVERDENETQSAVVFSVVSNTNAFETGDEPDGHTDGRVQFDCMASDKLATAFNAFKAVNESLKTFRALQPNGATIAGLRRESWNDISDITGQQKTYRITADYIVTYLED